MGNTLVADDTNSILESSDVTVTESDIHTVERARLVSLCRPTIL
jgi:hypothetical protein